MGQHVPIELSLQLDGIPYFQYPPLGSGSAATTGTRDLASRPPTCVSKRGREHGPVRLDVPSLPQDLGEALPDVDIKDLLSRGLGQTVPTDPHNRFVSARPVTPSPLYHPQVKEGGENGDSEEDPAVTQAKVTKAKNRSVQLLQLVYQTIMVKREPCREALYLPVSQQFYSQLWS